jgi:hypothetical protein
MDSPVFARSFGPRLIGALLALACGAGAAAQPLGERALEPVSAYAAPVVPADAAPFGLAVLWRATDRRLDLAARTAGEFSTNGGLLGIGSGGSISVLDAGSGDVVQRVPASITRQAAYSFAIAPDGRVAIGRTGGLEIRTPAARSRSTRFDCVDACGPVQAVTFSPDGSLLAYQGTRSTRERRQGLGYVVVLDARTGHPVARLEAIAARAFVTFTADGRELVASNATRIDDTEVFGLRGWDTAEWALTRNLLGGTAKWRAIGAAGDGRFVAAYERGGQLELRDLGDERLIWSAPLVGPPLEAA